MNPLSRLRDITRNVTALAAGWVVLWAGLAASHAGDLSVRVRHTFNHVPLSMGALALTNDAGNVLSVTRLDYLLSEFVLVSAE